MADERRVEVTRIDSPENAAAGHAVEDALFREVVRLREAGAAAALATVIGVRGSSPAQATMKLLVRGDGTTLGSVGGGCLEEEVRLRAADVLEDEQPARFSMRLTEDESPGGELICGGDVEVYIEPVTVPTLVLYGGGHVAHATATLAARVGFRIVVTDDRPSYASRERFPMAAETVVAYPDEAARSLPIDGATSVLVMTRSHRDDERILLELWRRGARPRYLGMIGSGRKLRSISEALKAEGVSPGWLRRLRSPVGLRIGAKTAAEIAVSIVAELIAQRRGRPTGRWSLAASDDASTAPEPDAP